MSKNKRHFNGDWEEIVKLFGFKKVNQTEEEDFVYEVFRLELKGSDLEIEITVEHWPEHPDTVYFELVCQEAYIPDFYNISIRSKEDLKTLIIILTGKEIEL